jgi:hypothetical protein
MADTIRVEGRADDPTKSLSINENIVNSSVTESSSKGMSSETSQCEHSSQGKQLAKETFKPAIQQLSSLLS